ncbi:hypothetical protein MAUB1S_06465 [Mycolicibacterium aubagnense]
MNVRSNSAHLARPDSLEVTVVLVSYFGLLAIISAFMLRIPDDQAAFRGNFGMAGNGIVAVLAFTAAFSIRIGNFRAFGFRTVPWKWMLAGAAIGFAAYGASHVMESVYFLLVTEVNTQADFQAGAKEGIVPLLILLFTGALLTPIGEELVFRAVVANALNRYPAGIGVVGSALIFAAAHGPSVIFFNAFLIGILTAFLFRKTLSIWPGLVVHVVFNALWLVTYALA